MGWVLTQDETRVINLEWVSQLAILPHPRGDGRCQVVAWIGEVEVETTIRDCPSREEAQEFVLTLLRDAGERVVKMEGGSDGSVGD